MSHRSALAVFAVPASARGSWAAMSVAAAACLLAASTPARGAVPSSAAPASSTFLEVIPLGSAFSTRVAISRHGRFTAITARTPGTRNGQVWVWDRKKKVILPVSVSPSGDPGKPRRSEVADISLDGRYVLFSSQATNLVPGDTNGRSDAFVRDLATSTTQRVSLSPLGDQLSSARANAMTADGRVVFFSTRSRVLPGDRNGHTDVYSRDLITGRTHLVSRNSRGRTANGRSNSARTSANGRWVAFLSNATNLARGDRSADTDVFLRNLRTGRTRLASGKPGRHGQVASLGGISGDGRVVAYNAYASDASGEAVRPFVYQEVTGRARDILGNKTTRNWGEVTLNSPHGNLMTIGTNAFLTRGDTSRKDDVYLVRLGTWTFRLLTKLEDPTNIFSWQHVLSRDGHVVFFQADHPYLRELP